MVRCDRFVQAVLLIDIHHLVTAVVANGQQPARNAVVAVDLAGPGQSSRASIRWLDQACGQLQLSLSGTTSAQTFVLTRIRGRPGGRQWGAICPVTAKPVEFLYVQDGRIGSRYALELRYRSSSMSRRQRLADTPAPPLRSVGACRICCGNRASCCWISDEDVVHQAFRPMADAGGRQVPADFGHRVGLHSRLPAGRSILRPEQIGFVS